MPLIHLMRFKVNLDCLYLLQILQTFNWRRSRTANALPYLDQLARIGRIANKYNAKVFFAVFFAEKNQCFYRTQIRLANYL